MAEDVVNVILALFELGRQQRPRVHWGPVIAHLPRQEMEGDQAGEEIIPDPQLDAMENDLEAQNVEPRSSEAAAAENLIADLEAAQNVEPGRTPATTTEGIPSDQGNAMENGNLELQNNKPGSTTTVSTV